jgi:tryptophan-rich sensory protein
MNQMLQIALSFGTPFIAAVVGSVFTAKSIPIWYATLRKPKLAPPNWLFGPVWTVLYIMMGFSLYLAWTNAPQNSNAWAIVFGSQLFLNALWSVLFFGLRRPGLAVLEIAVLWFAILETIILFYPLSTTAAWLLLPYLAWSTFAGYLNFQIWILNKN